MKSLNSSKDPGVSIPLEYSSSRKKKKKIYCLEPDVCSKSLGLSFKYAINYYEGQLLFIIYYKIMQLRLY